MHGRRTVLTVVAIITALAILGSSRAGLVVDDDPGPWRDFGSIQDAVNASANGTVIRVYSGSYDESIVVNKSVSLIGNGSALTEVASAETEVIGIIADDVQFSGFGILDYSGSGLLVSGSNATISNSIFSGSGTGASLLRTHNATVVNCTFYNGTGIRIVVNGSHRILSNEFANSLRRSIIFDGSSGDEIVGNNFYGGNYSVAGTTLGTDWNDTATGNFWKMNLTDVDGDGIADYPLDVNGHGLDRFPSVFPLPTGAPDIIGPATRLTIDGPLFLNGTFFIAEDSELNLTSVDSGGVVEGIRYSLDNGGLVEFTGNFTITGEGLHTLKCVANDTLGNTEYNTTYWVYVDSSAPTLKYVDWAEFSDFIMIDGAIDKLWFGGVMSGTETAYLNGSAFDATRGPITLSFSPEPNIAYDTSVVITGSHTTWTSEFGFNSTSTTSGADMVLIDASDILGNSRTFAFAYEADVDGPTWDLEPKWVEGDDPGVTEDVKWLNIIDGTLWYGADMVGTSLASVEAFVSDNHLLSRVEYSMVDNITRNPDPAGTLSGDSDHVVGAVYGFNSTSNGTGNITITVYDWINNSLSYQLGFDRDASPPQLDNIAWREDSDFLSVNASGHLIFGPGMQDDHTFATLRGNFSDDVGLAGASFNTEPGIARSPGDGRTPNIPGMSMLSGVYDEFITQYGFDEDSTGDGIVKLSAEDHVGNDAMVEMYYLRDDEEPTLEAHWEEGSRFLAIISGSLWFGDDMVSSEEGRLVGSTTDENGIQGVVFSREPNLLSGPSNLTGGSLSLNFTEPVLFNSVSSSGDFKIVLTAYDVVSNTRSLSMFYYRDVNPPTFQSADWSEDNDNFWVDDEGRLWFGSSMKKQVMANITGRIHDTVKADLIIPSDESDSNVFRTDDIIRLNDSSADFTVGYLFDANSTASGTPVTLNLLDAVNNSATVNLPYGRNSISPSFTVDGLAEMTVIDADHDLLVNSGGKWIVRLEGTVDSNGGGPPRLILSVDDESWSEASIEDDNVTWMFESQDLYTGGWHKLVIRVKGPTGNGESRTYWIYKAKVADGSYAVRSVSSGRVDLVGVDPLRLYLNLTPQKGQWVAVSYLGTNTSLAKDDGFNGLRYIRLEFSNDTRDPGGRIDLYYTFNQLSVEGMHELGLSGIMFENTTSGSWELYRSSGVYDFEPAQNILGRWFEGFAWADFSGSTEMSIASPLRNPIIVVNETTRTAGIYHDLFDRGLSTSYDIKVLNAGSQYDSIRLSAEGPDGWSFRFFDDGSGQNGKELTTALLEPGDTAVIRLEVVIKDGPNTSSMPVNGIDAERSYSFDVTARSSTLATERDSLTLEAVIKRPDLSIQVMAYEEEFSKGEDVPLVATIDNLGNWTSIYEYPDLTAIPTGDIWIEWSYGRTLTGHFTVWDKQRVERREIGPGMRVFEETVFTPPGTGNHYIKAQIIYGVNESDEYEPGPDERPNFDIMLYRDRASEAVLEGAMQFPRLRLMVDTTSHYDENITWITSNTLIWFTAMGGSVPIDSIEYRTAENSMWGDWEEYELTAFQMEREGDYSLEFLLVSSNGYRTRAAIENISLDDSPPSMGLVLGERNSLEDGDDLRIAAVDHGVGVAIIFFKIEGHDVYGEWQNYTKPIELDVGTYDVAYYAIDHLGHTSEIENTTVRIIAKEVEAFRLDVPPIISTVMIIAMMTALMVVLVLRRAGRLSKLDLWPPPDMVRSDGDDALTSMEDMDHERYHRPIPRYIFGPPEWDFSGGEPKSKTASAECPLCTGRLVPATEQRGWYCLRCKKYV